jgi:uncharacterized protein
MSRARLHDLSALAAGLVFGAGLAVSGMTRPQKVIGFLDVLGDWDASLMFVMLGAIAVHTVGYRWKRAQNAPLFAAKFLVPSRRDLDAKLVLGAAVFGAGWGLGGYCPGPGLVSLAGGGADAAIFVSAMLAGLFAAGRLEARSTHQAPESARTPPSTIDSRGTT